MASKGNPFAGKASKASSARGVPGAKGQGAKVTKGSSKMPSAKATKGTTARGGFPGMKAKRSR